MSRIRTAIFLLFASISTALAENGIFCRIVDIAPNSGLVQRHVSNSLIDKSGFIWLATWNGLVRFDGYNFYTFKPTVYSQGGIITNRVYNMKLNGNNDIWCVSLDDKLYHFDTRLCHFTNISAPIASIADKNVAHIYTLKQPVSWIDFKDGTCMRVNDLKPQEEHTVFAPGKLFAKGAKIYKVRRMNNGDEWILTNKEAVCYNTKVHIKGNYKFIFESRNKHYFVDNKGNVYLIRRGRASLLMKLWDKDTKVMNVTVKDGIAAIATTKGLAIADTKSGKATKHLEGKEIVDAQFDSHKNVWAFTPDNNVSMVASSNKTTTTFSAKHSAVETKRKTRQIFFEDNDGCVILKPMTGVLSAYNSGSKQFTPIYFTNPQDKEKMPNTEISRYIVDSQKNLWCFHEERSIFLSFNHRYFSTHNNDKSVETRAMMRDHSGREWISDRSNAIAIYSKGKKQRAFLQQNGSIAPSAGIFAKSPIYCITEDPKHRVWIGTKGEGVYLLTPSSASGTQYKVEHFSAKATDKAHHIDCDSIYAIAPDAAGNTWIGTYGKGLIKTITDKNGNTFFKPLRLKAEYNKVRTIKAYNKDILLVGTTAGLASIDMRTGGKDIFYNTYRKEDWGMKASDVMEIIVAGNKVYLCIYGDGISEVVSDDLLSNDLHFKNTPLPTSAAADQIKAAIWDGKSIWVVSETVLVKFIIEKKRLYIFDQDDFMSDLTFSEAKPIISDREITVGTSNGYVCFDADITPLSPANKIVFTGIQYQNDMEIRPINDLKKLTIEPDQRSFSLYLSSLDYPNRKNIRFRYRLEGYDKSWNYADEGQHAVNYSNLPAGDYQLVVEATDANGTWGECHREIKVSVTPLFTETIWFRLFIAILVICAIIGMIYAIIYLSKMRRVLQKKYSLLMTVEEVTPKIEAVNKPKAVAETDKIIKDTVEYISQNITQSNILVDDLARHLGMSRTAYYTRIKETTGLSPSDFIRQLRIRHALKLLKKGDLPISEVAFKVGYTDPKYFTKCFKAEMEMTPSQYIQQSKNEE